MMSTSDEHTNEERSDQPQVGTDPMQLPQEESGPKKQVAPDPDEVEDEERD